MELNDTIKSQLEHRTIRAFKEESIPKDIYDTLIEVARRTASSTGMQAFSIIRVTDSQIRRDISAVCNQEYVATAPELLIFVADQFRNLKIAEEMGCFDERAANLDRFFQSYTDASLAAQNVVNAAESLGLGTVFLGSILNDSEKICQLLHLPKLTYPVLGLGIGYPDQNPQLKPRMDMNLRVFENTYKIFDNYLEEIKEYDEKMQEYYDLREANKRVDSFSRQVVSKIINVIPKRQAMFDIVRKQGFKEFKSEE